MHKYLILILLFPALCYSDSNSLSLPSNHAPIGVMGEHLHSKGEVMASYRYMSMRMDGNRSGSSRISDQEVLEEFPVTPTDMDMDMHMLGLMYAPSDNLTLMAMLPYVELSMNHITRNGTKFRTRSEGIGDAKIAGLYRLLQSENSNLILNLGLSLPTGNIDARDDTPAADDAQLPYPMQIGSGTVDFMPGLTFSKHIDFFSFGAQGLGTFRIGRNSNDYSLGDRFDGSFWTALDLSDYLSFSIRTAWSILTNVDGADPLLNPLVVSTADPNLRGGRRMDVGLGINFLMPNESFRLAAEYLSPIYQNLNGPQLEVDSTWVFGVQYTF